MKSLLLTTFISLSFLVLNAQKTGLQKATENTCKCLEKVKDSIKNEADFDKYGESCIIKAAFPVFAEIAKEENISLDDMNSEEQGRKIGEKIGMKLITDCPIFADLIAKHSLGNKEETEVAGKLTGTVTAVEEEGYLAIQVKDAGNKIVKLIWTEYFPGSDIFKTSPSTLKGKKVTIAWKQVELYVPKHKDFIPCKVITKLSTDE